MQTDLPRPALVNDPYDTSLDTARHSPIRRWGEPLAIGVLALAVRSASLQHAPYVDEINHIMAAQSLLANGSMQLADGAEYTRGALLTYIIAGFFALFGESLVVARIPALLAGVLLVVALFAWMRSVDGSLSAWIAGLLLTLSPGAIYFSQQARFYSLHPLLVFVAAMAVYHVVTAERLRWRREGVLLVLLALLSVRLAQSFQPSALIGAAVLVAWAVVATGVRWWLRGRHRDASILAAVSGSAAIAGAMLLVLSPTLRARYANLATQADEWAAAGVDEVLFYYWHFERQYPVLLALFPLLALLALVRRARVAIFALAMFVVPVAIHSLLAWKHERYVAYALPFLFAIVGLGVAQAVHWIFPALREWLHAAARGVLPRTVTALAAAALLVLAGLFALRANRSFTYATELITQSDAEWEHEIAYRGEADWQAAAPVLRDYVEDANVVVSSIELKAMYYFGRQDVLLSRDYIRNEEFVTFRKMRRPAISTPESLALLMSCVPSGLVLVEERQWRKPWGVLPETADLLERRAERIPLPAHARLHAFHWSGGADTRPGCQLVADRVRVRETSG